MWDDAAIPMTFDDQTFKERVMFLYVVTLGAENFCAIMVALVL